MIILGNNPVKIALQGPLSHETLLYKFGKIVKHALNVHMHNIFSLSETQQLTTWANTSLHLLIL